MATKPPTSTCLVVRWLVCWWGMLLVYHYDDDDDDDDDVVVDDGPTTHEVGAVTLFVSIHRNGGVHRFILNVQKNDGSKPWSSRLNRGNPWVSRSVGMGFHAATAKRRQKNPKEKRENADDLHSKSNECA